jgi:hypothetical protein
MQIEKFISPFIENQFPQFYQEEGPLFIEFVKAYYEWLESTGNIIELSRSLVDIKDIDTTLEKYLIYFKNKYINALPENIVSDKKLLIKHILDLYRSKGSESSYKLLFKIIFNEDISTYLPSTQLFKLSDAEWEIPKYIEVSDHPHLTKLIGNKIYSSSSFSTAVVENYYVKNVNNKVINVLVLSNILGNIKYGERIFSEAVPEISNLNAPIVFGSLSSVSILNGGINYNVGEILKIQNSGSGGLARIISTTSVNGECIFDLISGGTGFSLNAVVNVDGRAIKIKDASQTNPVVITTEENHNLKDSTNIRIDVVKGMDDLNVSTYAYYVKVLTDNTFSVYKNISLTETLNGTSFNPYYQYGYVFVSTGATQQSTFKIGSIVNKEIYNVNLDHISDMYSEEMEIMPEGFNINISGINGTFSSGDIIFMDNVNVLETECTLTSDATNFVNGETLSLVNNNGTITSKNLKVVNTDDTYMQLTGSDITGITNNLLPLNYISSQSKTTLTVNHAYGINTVNAYSNAIIVTGSSVTANSLNVGYFVYGQQLKSIGTVCTISIASPAVITVPASSAPETSTTVVFQNTGGALPTGITAGTTYYVKKVNTYQFQISATDNGTSINTSGTQSGISIAYYNKATATIGTVNRLTDWGMGIGVSLPRGVLKNLDSNINILQFRQKEVGTIASLTNINPGKGYSVDPIVSIVEPLIYDLGIVEPFGAYAGTIKGYNSNINAKASSANGIVTAISIVDSGFGYDRDQIVELISNSNPYAVSGTSVVDKIGIGKGYWKDNKSFISDEMYLQDSYYYQKYSYEIIAPRMLNTYEKYVKNLVHPTGILLFGKFVISDELTSENTEASSFELSSYYTLTVDDITITVDNNTIKSDHM